MRLRDDPKIISCGHVEVDDASKSVDSDQVDPASAPIQISQGGDSTPHALDQTSMEERPDTAWRQGSSAGASRW